MIGTVKRRGMVVPCLAAVWAIAGGPAGAGLPAPSSIWAYLTFDDTLEPLLPSDGFRKVEAIGDAKPAYAAGLVGRALDVRQDTCGANTVHGRSDFPGKQGSLLVWFKPSKALAKESRWLVIGGWSSFDIHVEAGRLLAYASGESRQHLIGSLEPWREQWTDRWHLAVLTWDMPRIALYLDGRRLADRADAKPFAPWQLTFGLLSRPRGTPSRVGILEGLLDEVAILRVALSGEQVADLHRRGTAEGYRGLLSAMGGAVLVSLPRHGFVRGETIAGRVACYAEGQQVRLSAMPEAGGSGVALATLPAGHAPFRFDTRQLRPGRYRLRAELLREGAAVLTGESPRLNILARRRPEFPIGIDGLPGYPDDVLRQAADWHIDHTSAGGNVDDALYWHLDRLARYGLAYAPSLAIHHQRYMPLPDRESYFDPETGRGTLKLQQEVLQNMVLSGDERFSIYSSSLGSPFSKVAREAMRRRLNDFYRASRGHPGLVAIAFDDEYCLRFGRDKDSGRMYYGDYCADARAFFTQQTGLAPAFPPQAPPGTVFPDDHPYFRWRDVIGLPGDPTCTGLSRSWGELTALSHRLRPDVQTTTWSGGEYGSVDAVMDYGYPMIWQPSPGFDVGHGRMDWDMDEHRARQRVRPLKPLWGLIGWWSADLRGKPDHCVADFRLNTLLALAKGVESICWFTTYDPKPDPDRMGGGVLSRDDLRAEMVRWAEWLHRFGPTFKRYEVRPSRRVAVLFSEDNLAGQIHRGGWPSGALWFYPALRVAGVPVDIVTDEQVKAGILDRYEALVLYDFEYASRSLWDRIEAYAATQGKQVFVDKATKLKPDKAIELPFAALGGAPADQREAWAGLQCYGTRNLAWMAGRLRTLVTPRLRPSNLRVSGSDLVAPFWLYSRGKGRSRLLVLANYSLTAPQKVEVLLQADAGVVVQALEGGRVVAQCTPSQPTMIWPVTLDPASAAIYLVTDAPIGELDSEAGFDAGAGAFTVRVAAHAQDGQPLRASLPVRLEWIDPSGRSVRAYERFTALQPDGTLHLRLPRAREMDPAGQWTVRVTDLVTGRQATSRFQVE